MKTIQGLEVGNAIFGRRAIRRFTAEVPERALLEGLVAAATQAPSAMNMQPWAFAIIVGADRLKAYSDRAKAQLLSTAGPLSTAASALLGPEVNIFHGAPALIVICATSPERQAAEDCCLAAQNLMLSAFAAGLGTCPIGFARPWLSSEEAKREIGIPAELVPVFPIAIGVPDEEPVSHGRHDAHIIWI